MRSFVILASAAASFAWLQPALAHHSFAPLVSADGEDVIEIYDGSIEIYKLLNPHTALLVNVTNEDGDIEDWLVEMSSLSTLIREGCTDESMSAGDEITIAILRSRTAYRGRLLFGMYKSSDEMIEMRHELGGAIRSILMDAAPPAADRLHTKLGYSSGHWENDVLAIETTHLSGGMIFTNRGYPISGEARIIERYWREDGQNLQMELFVYDAVNYTEPLRFALEWIWSPDEQVLAWDCISLGPGDAEPDMDELRRLLNQQ